jgi:hypothetical protein
MSQLRSCAQQWAQGRIGLWVLAVGTHRIFTTAKTGSENRVREHFLIVFRTYL